MDFVDVAPDVEISTPERQYVEISWYIEYSASPHIFGILISGAEVIMLGGVKKAVSPPQASFQGLKHAFSVA